MTGLYTDYFSGHRYPWSVRNGLGDVLDSFETEAEAEAFIRGVLWVSR